MVASEELLSASVSETWSALTVKEKMKNWYFDLSEFKPKIGFKFEFLSGETQEKQYLHLCEILEVIPNKKLRYSWQYDKIGGISIVTFELSEHKNQTLIKVSHGGLETFPQDLPDFAAVNFQAGWDFLIKISLKNY